MKVPDIETLHKDIALANGYRIEVIKYCILTSAALLAFTVSFRPGLQAPSHNALIWISWLALGLSTIGGVGNMYGWEQFYISYRNYDFKSNGERGKIIRDRITVCRRISMFFQFAGLVVGVLSIAVYFALNVDKVKAV